MLAVADPKVFRSGREFAAWLGLVPRQNSTGGKTRLGGITKRGTNSGREIWPPSNPRLNWTGAMNPNQS
jgi:transposase